MKETNVTEAIKWAEHMDKVLDSNIKCSSMNDIFKKFHDECLVHKSCLSVLKSCAEEMLAEAAINVDPDKNTV